MLEGGQHWLVGRVQHERHLLLLRLVLLLDERVAFVPGLPVVLPYVRFLNVLEDDWQMPMKRVVAEINNIGIILEHADEANVKIALNPRMAIIFLDICFIT